MTRPGDRDGFDDEDATSGWREPAHLQGDDEDADRPNFADRRRTPREEGEMWTPPGWDLPPAERPEPVDRVADEPAPETPERPAPERPAPAPGPFGRRAPRPPTEFERTFAYQGDVVGTQAWAVHHGWTISDGTAPEDAPLAGLVASAPGSRISKDHRAAGVIRGRADQLDLVAFDVAYVDRARVVPQYAITAAPLLLPIPYFRLSPARLWRHRVSGLVQLPTGDEQFDRRWVLATAEDSPEVRRLAGDPGVRQALLATDDGDEFWAAAGYVAAIRPDGHRPLLVEHHARLLTVLVRALTGGI
jgi:hypothetical protein